MVLTLKIEKVSVFLRAGNKTILAHKAYSHIAPYTVYRPLGVSD